MTCSEPLVWTCKSCANSFQLDEWQEHGRLCPACNAHEGSWHCGKCQAGFTQPSLGSEHPCLANTPQGKRVRIVSRTHSSTHLNPRSASLIAPSPTPSRQDEPIRPRNKLRLPTLVILLIGIGVGFMFSSWFALEAGKQKQFDTSTTATSVLSNPQRKTTDDSIHNRETEKAGISNSEPRLAPSRPKPQVATPSPLNPTPKGYTELNPPAAPSATATPSTPPPDIFRDRSAVAGNAQMGQDASFADPNTPLGRYQHKLYLAIGSRWNLKVQQTMSRMEVSRVIVQFHVNPDGSLSELEIAEGDSNSILAIISGDSIQQSSGLLGPFPADLLKAFPNGFPWKLAFRIY